MRSAWFLLPSPAAWLRRGCSWRARCRAGTRPVIEAVLDDLAGDLKGQVRIAAHRPAPSLDHCESTDVPSQRLLSREISAGGATYVQYRSPDSEDGRASGLPRQDT